MMLREDVSHAEDKKHLFLYVAFHCDMEIKDFYVCSQRFYLPDNKEIVWVIAMPITQLLKDPVRQVWLFTNTQ